TCKKAPLQNIVWRKNNTIRTGRAGRRTHMNIGKTLICGVAAAIAAWGQASGDKVPASKSWRAAEDHQNMMEQLGIKSLRPGPSGNESAPNHANYDDSKANPFPDLPDVLTTRDGKKVTTPEIWWQVRRPEIVEDFDREVLGRVPADVPKVTWSVAATSQGTMGATPITNTQLVGHVDNSACPAFNVDIRMTLVTPADAKAP